MKPFSYYEPGLEVTLDDGEFSVYLDNPPIGWAPIQWDVSLPDKLLIELRDYLNENYPKCTGQGGPGPYCDDCAEDMG